MKKVDVNGVIHLCLFAVTDIATGQQLLFDYGEESDQLFWRQKVVNVIMHQYVYTKSVPVFLLTVKNIMYMQLHLSNDSIKTKKTNNKGARKIAMEFIILVQR